MLWWALETTLVAAALAAVAALAPRLRPLGPSARHALWLVVLIKLMTPPLLSWPWPVLTLPTHDRGDRRAPATAEVTPPDRADAGAEAAVAVVEGQGTVTADAVAEAVDVAGAEAEAWTDVGALGPDPGPVATRGTLAVPDARALERGVLGGWLIVAAGVAAGQIGRIVRFRKRLEEAVPAPAWAAAEIARVAARLGVRVPEALVVPGLGVPMLWCLGRPKLLLPSRLVETLGIDRWRCVFAHELAHVRRGDPWVGRLTMVAGWLWWWNPVYWLARHRLDAEAELACDAWVVWVLPDARLVYAETLLDVSASLSPSPLSLPSASPSTSVEFPTVQVPSPVLGVTGAGRFFERRLTMILRDQVPCRLSLPALFGAGFLTLLGLPSWTVAEPPRVEATAAVDEASVESEFEFLFDFDADDAADEDDDDPPSADARKPKPKPNPDPKPSPRTGKRSLDIEIDLSDLEEALGPDSELVRSLEKLLGPDSELIKTLEKLGPELEKKMKEKLGPGSDFEKKMKEVKEKLGPGSDFEKKIKEMSQKIEKDVTQKFGPGSDFEKKMKDLAEREQERAGREQERAGREQERAEREQERARVDRDRDRERARAEQEQERARAERDRERARAERERERERGRSDRERPEPPAPPTPPAPAARPARPVPPVPPAPPTPPAAASVREPEFSPPARAGRGSREERIKALESMIDKISAELKRLKEDEGGDDGKRR